MKEIYLPELKKIEVEKYSLYYQEPSFSFEFKDGISAIIGANGIGKTTFVNIIIYCIVGFKKSIEKKDKNDIDETYKFFGARVSENYAENENAKAFLEFNINNRSVKIGRSLINDKILYFEVDGKEDVNIDENKYKNFISEESGISSFDDFEKIVRSFLFFDELRNNIAWEADMQDDILRILLFDEEYFTKFKMLEKDVTEWDSQGRHTSEEKRMAIKALNDLVDEKKQVVDSIGKQINSNDSNQESKKIDLDQLFKSKNILDDSVKVLQIELNSLIINQKEKRNTLDELIGERDNISLKIERLSDQISQLETKLFSSNLEKLPDYYYTIEKALITNGECLVCNAKSKEIKDKAIKNSTEKRCIICSSKLVQEIEIDADVIDKINKLYEEKQELVIIYENKLKKIDILQKNTSELELRVKELDDLIDKKRKEIIYIESLIKENKSDNKGDTYTEIVKARQSTIEKLEKEIVHCYRKRDELKADLNALNSKFGNMISNLNSSLSAYFNKYASTFIGLKCELTVMQRVIKKVPHHIYIPRIDGTLRKDIWSVSESQRFFLDQAFRMAIIDYLQNTIKGFKTYFITETPEGSLDIAYEAQVAQMFIKFANSQNNIIFTSNLNSSNFLCVLFSKIDPSDRKCRILNLLEKGKITGVQKESLPKLQELMDRILGGIMK